MDEIISHYQQTREEARLQSGPGVLEMARTRELILRHLPPAPNIILDVGGGPGAYAAWLSDYPTAVGQMALAPHNLNLVRNEEKKAKPSLPRLVADFAAAQSHAKLYLAAVSALAAARPVVQQMKALHLQEARTLVAATNDYARGLKPYNQHLLNTGDLLWARFVTQVRASSRAEDGTYHRLGGYAAFKNRVDWNALASEMGSATSTGRSG